MSREQTVAVFEGLYRIIRHIPNPGECTSVERCIFSYMYDLCSSDTVLKTLPVGSQFYSTMYVRVRQTIYGQVVPNTTSNTSNYGQWNIPPDIKRIPTFMSDIILNYRKGGITFLLIFQFYYIVKRFLLLLLYCSPNRSSVDKTTK